jgi:hypothetical protein
MNFWAVRILELFLPDLRYSNKIKKRRLELSSSNGEERFPASALAFR